MPEIGLVNGATALKEFKGFMARAGGLNKDRRIGELDTDRD